MARRIPHSHAAVRRLVRAPWRALLLTLVLPSAAPGLLAQSTPPRNAERPTTLIPSGGCVTAECHSTLIQQRFVHAPISAGSCDGCHTLSDPLTHTFKDARPRDQICTLCHTIKTDNAITIHKPYADRDCLSCHDPHASKESALLRGDRYSDTCAACHADITHARNVVHGPAQAGACGACHQPHASRSSKLLNAEGRDLCLKCHESTAHSIASSPLVHEPVKGDCLVCHDPHSSTDRAMLNHDPNPLCISCHQGIAHTMETATTQHAAVTTSRACLNCHTSHAGHRPRLLRKDEAQLCMECHDRDIALPGGGKIRSMKGILDSGESLHGAIAARNCSVCHEIHGGGHRRLLTEEFPTDVYLPFRESAYALCFSCHDKQRVLAAKTTKLTEFRNGDTNLHYVHVNRDTKGRSCKVCHDAHAARRDMFIHDETPFGPEGWKLPLKFVRLPDGGKCGAGCHQSLEYNRVTPVAYPQLRTGDWKGDRLTPPNRAIPPDGPTDSKDK